MMTTDDIGMEHKQKPLLNAESAAENCAEFCGKLYPAVAFQIQMNE